MEDYDDKLAKRIETLFIHKIIPANFYILIHKHNLDILTFNDIERLKIMMTNHPNIDVNMELLCLMKRYQGWFQCILDVCGDPLLKMAWLKTKFEEIKRQLDAEIQQGRPPGARMSDSAPVGEGGSTAAGQGASNLATMETDSGTGVQRRNGQAAEARNCASVIMFEDDSKGCNLCKVRYQSEDVKDKHLESKQHKNKRKESNLQSVSPQSVKPKQSPPQSERTSVIEDHEFFYYDQNGSGKCMLCDAKYDTEEIRKKHFGGNAHKKKIERRKDKAREFDLSLGPEGEIFCADLKKGIGQCFVCHISYPSHEEKKKHVEGQKHKKKCEPLTSS